MLSSSILRSSLNTAFKFKPQSTPRNMTSKAAPLFPPPLISASFPSATARPSSIFPYTGTTPEATSALNRTLEENDRGYDAYGKPRFAHNHFTHSNLTRYALGAPADLISKTWEHDRGELLPLLPADDKEYGDRRLKESNGRYQLKPDEIPDKLTTTTWSDPKYLGQRLMYPRYLAFFHQEVARLGVRKAIETYVLSPEANGQGSDAPMMAIRLISGVVHPFIHLGFGLEFSERVVAAEGLAITAIHDAAMYTPLFPAGWPQTSLPKPTSPNALSRSLLGVYSEVLADERLKPGKYDPDALINARIRSIINGEGGKVIQEYISRWNLGDLSNEEDISKAVAECHWLATLLCGATSRPGYATRIDFFTMHFLTSSLFLEPYLRALPSPSDRRVILQTWALIVFLVALARGRPVIYIDQAMGYPLDPHGPRNPALPKNAGSAIGTPEAWSEQNPWLGIVENSLVAPDSHVPKTIRALLYYSQRYSTTPAGGVSGAIEHGQEVFPGAKNLDGSIFLRIAGRVIDVTGWVAEGETEHHWDRSALGWDGAWEGEAKL